MAPRESFEIVGFGRPDILALLRALLLLLETQQREREQHPSYGCTCVPCSYGEPDFCDDEDDY